MEIVIGSDYPKKVIPLLDNAKKNVDIIVYDWRWYEDQLAHPVQQFNMAVVRAVQRGVIVRAVVNAHILVPVLTKVGVKVRQLSDRRTMHSKLIIIDNETIVIGSHNFTRNAFASNIEASVILDLPFNQTRFQEFFNNLYGL
jgi:phosphatidylserine/phosphatidylglycerophosphate/cardiolipin synthase-like enzyme